MFKKVDFQPLPLMKSAHIQTIVGSYNFFIGSLSSDSFRVNLKDGDAINLEVSKPVDWKENGKISILVHGLGGDHNSHNMVRIAKKLLNEGHLIYRVNLRGCGSGAGLSSKLYHGGLSEDLKEVIEALHKEHPQAAYHLIGFSIGGNICLKLIGEWGQEASKWIQLVIAVCPPVDLESSIQMLAHPKNKIYEMYFFKRLFHNLQAIEGKQCPEFLKSVSKIQSVLDFDHSFTAKIWGFNGAKDYYERCSSKYFIPLIKIPCHILFAEDDPIVDHSKVIKTDSSFVTAWLSQHGGHMGFLGYPSKKGHGPRWLDSKILEWMEEKVIS